LLPVSCCVHNSCRACIGCFPYFRAINVYCIINYSAAAVWPVNVVDVVNTHVTVVGNLPDLINSWAGYISTVVINISVVNNSSTVNYIYHAGLRYIIVVNVWPVDISLWCANPVIIRYAIAITKRYADANAWL